ncbi:MULTISPECIES: leucine efflux protein LeuE [unclassified Streptomyces]|uniref:leucine efflux protein LeuE n=1 Tax=unclassified Streptomyces TaxID=2593676 RepID=UPI0037F7DA74
MLGITDLPTYLLGTVLIVLLPGPNSLYTLSVAARRGVRTAYRAALGVFLGDTVLMTASAAGVAGLLTTNPVLFGIVKYAGAGYLAWIAFGMARAAWRMWRGRAEPEPEVAPAAADGPAQAEQPFRRALVISLLNPKAILFFISFFVQFVDPGYAHPALSFLALGAIAQVFSFSYLTLLIFGGTYLAGQFRRRRRLAAGLTSGAAALFLGFAAKLSMASSV